jgi:putative transposase
MRKDPDLAFLNEVSWVPLQQALHHQHQAFRAFSRKRTRYPRFESRPGRQSGHRTRSAFSLRGGKLRLAKMSDPLRFAWSWPEVDVASLDPAMVIVSREPDGRRYVTFTAAKNILAAGLAVSARGTGVRHSGSSGRGRRRNRNPSSRGLESRPSGRGVAN